MDPHGHRGGLLSPFLEWFRIQHALTYVHPYSRVLEVGCGHARLLDHANPERYVGLDTDEPLLAQNRARHPSRRFSAIDPEVDALPRDLGEFDVIVVLAALARLRAPEETVARLAGHLDTGGRIVMTCTHTRAAKVLPGLVKLGLLGEADATWRSPLSREGIEALGRRAGLGLEVYERFLFGLDQLVLLRP